MAAGNRTSSPSAGFSWRRGLLHGLIPLALAVAVSGVLVAAGKVSDPERFGEGVGRFGFFLFLTGVGISWLFQRGRRATGWVLTGSLLALVAAGVVVAVLMGGPEPLSAAERAPLERVLGDAGPELRHPALGFALADPGARFQPLAQPQAEQVAGQLAEQPEMQAYVYNDAAAGEILLIVLAKGLTQRSELDGMAQGLREGFTQRFDGPVLRDEQTWTDERHEAWFEGQLPGLGYLETRTVATHLGPEAGAFAVSVMAITRQRGALRGVLQSLRTQ